jgi:predicted phosphodiesterase
MSSIHVKDISTRLAVISDIHGNLPALEAVLADARQHDVDGYVVAGDFSDGPQAPDVIRTLHTLNGWMVRGNRESYFLTYDAGDAPDSWYTGGQWAGFRWMYRRLGRETLDFIASLPEQRVISIDGRAPIRVVHGSLSNASGLFLPERDAAALDLYERAGLLELVWHHARLDTALAQIDEMVLVCAHSHIPWQQEHSGRLVLNPGSVGAPINEDARAQYALLTWENGRWQAENRAIPYDLLRIRAAYHESGELAAGGVMARAFLLCVETGRNVPGWFVSYVRGLAREAGYENLNDAPEALWEQAEATFDWEMAVGRR